MTDIVPQIAALIGVNPSTLVLLIFVITTTANAGARLIPDDATGVLGVTRRVCKVIGVYVSSRITAGTTVNDVAKAALATPPIPGKVDAQHEEDAK